MANVRSKSRSGMIPEERDEIAYQSLNWRIRLLIRLCVYLMNILNSVLKPYSMTPIFAIYDLSEEMLDIEEEEEEILQ